MEKKSNNKNEIRMAGFSAVGRESIIDRAEVVCADGSVDYNLLVNKVNELGNRLSRESHFLQNI